MKAFILIILAGLIMNSFSSKETWTAPTFCKGYECPRYKLVQTLENQIEIREYEDSNWVTTEMQGADREKNTKNHFWSLFNYISGNNSKKEKISMTVPVLVKSLSKIPFTSDDVNGFMSFYLGYKFQEDVEAPKPDESGVLVRKLPSKKYAVLSYGGYSNQKEEHENLVKLGTYLSREGISYVNSYYYYAGYDAPYKFWSRHNEIWIELI
jgi:hypothetical protein